MTIDRLYPLGNQVVGFCLGSEDIYMTWINTSFMVLGMLNYCKKAEELTRAVLRLKNTT